MRLLGGLLGLGLLLLLPGPLGPAHAADHGAFQDLTPFVSYLEDAQQRLDIHQVAGRQDGFVHFDKPELRAGITRTAYWFRLTLPSGAWLLEVGSPFLDRVDLYLPRADGGYEVIRSGDAVPFSERQIAHRHPVFLFPDLRAGPAYLHVQSEGLVTIPLQLWRPDTFASHVAHEEFGFGLYYGIMVVMILYNLSLFLFVQDRSYLYYVLYIAAYVLFQAAFNGYGPMYLWPDWPWWAGRAPIVLVGAAALAALVFSRHFLDVRRHAPHFARALRGLEFAAVATMALALLGPYYLAAKVANGLGLAVVIVVLPAAILCRRRGNRAARWFVTAWSFFLLGILVTGLDIAGLLAEWPYWVYPMQIGSSVEILLLSIALADRINALRQEKDEALAQADRHLHRLNTELDTLVRERTDALERAKEEAEALSGQLAARNATLEQIAVHDSLTGALNRAAFAEQLAQRIAEFERHGTSFALAMIDLDHFKAINDSFGHAIGDQVLREVAGALTCGNRSSDFLGRYGGEEFLLFIGHLEAETAGPVAERLRLAIAAITLPDLPQLKITASFGVSWPLHGEQGNLANLLTRRADNALYLAKKLGRNRVCTQSDLVREARLELAI